MLHKKPFRRDSRYAVAGFLLILQVSLLVSCRSVKPWQRVYLNDEAMQTGTRSVEKFPSSVHTNREASTGGGTGRSSGGCGCN